MYDIVWIKLCGNQIMTDAELIMFERRPVLSLKCNKCLKCNQSFCLPFFMTQNSICVLYFSPLLEFGFTN